MNRHIKNSIRVPLSSWEDDAAFEEFLGFIGDYRDCVQQIAFFSSEFHPPLPLQTAAARFALLRERMALARNAGFSAGINILSTVGHHPERMDEALEGPWRRAANINGETCSASFCPGDPRYLLAYVKPLYTMCCEAKPDFIWIDDDVRSGHLPVGNTCFCDGCMADFNRENGYAYTRETLTIAFDGPNAKELRERWLAFQSEKIARLLRLIRRTVNDCDDGIMLGFMTGERYFEGYDFPQWAAALSDDGKYEIMWRPGGGAYTDLPFSVITEKAQQIGRQCARLPKNVISVQSEIEHFPYRLLQKSPRATALETLLHVRAGCTGAAFNLLPSTEGGESVHVMRGHFDAIRNMMPFERLLSDLLGRSPTVGVYDGWHPHGSVAAQSFIGGGGGYSPDHWNRLFSLGLPESFDFDASGCYLLTGRAPLAFSEEALLHMLSSGVFMDAEALEVLNASGYASLTGFCVERTFEDDHVEVYASHPLNAGFEGRRRLCPQVFVRGTSAALKAMPGAECLSYLTDFHGRKAADCSLGIYTNSRGGRICVSSHYAAADPGDTFKSRQIKRCFRFLSGDRLGFCPVDCVRLSAVVRRTDAGDVTVLFNPNLDRLTDVRILLSGELRQIEMVTDTMERTLLPATGRDGAMTSFLLPSLSPYSMAALLPVNG